MKNQLSKDVNFSYIYYNFNAVTIKIMRLTLTLENNSISFR